MSFSSSGGRSSTNVRDLLTRGKAAAKAGDREEAEFYLQWVLQTESSDAQKQEAWLWLSEVSDDPAQKRAYLEEILAYNPAHARARRRLAILDGRLREEDIVDPDRLQPVPDETRPADTRRFLCPRCSARMVFTPDGESLYCEHCGYGQQQEESVGAVAEQDFIVTMATSRGHLKPETMQVFECSGCAASYLLEPQAISVTCPYCEATYAVEMTETRELVPPQGIIPFAFKEDRARMILNRWLEHHKLPGGRVALHGVYLPVWTFDVGGSIGWQGQLYNYHSQTRQWESISGEHPIFYDDYLVPASTRLPEKLANSVLGTFDLTAVTAFSPEYLAAWPAQTYEATVGDASLAARQGVLRKKRPEVTNHVELKGQVRDLSFRSASLQVESYKLLLLPLWIGHYRYQEKTYTAVVNGQNGRVTGQRPRRSDIGGWLRRLFD